MPNEKIVAVLGAGNMGTAVAQVIARNGYKVHLWNYAGDPAPLRQIEKWRENKKYLPGVKLSENIIPVAEISRAVCGASLIFFVVPSGFVAGVIRKAAPYLPKSAVCVDASKGIDEKSLGIIPDVIKAGLPRSLRNRVATISGPAVAVDMVKGGFTAMNIASQSRASIAAVKKAMESDSLKLVATSDMIGVEITGSFKNVYAIAMGICDGLGLPMNTKAALLVLALREISALVEKTGGKAETVYDLAGLGDLVGTGLCASSRNRRFGEYLSRGCRVKEAARKVGQVVEGIRASGALHRLNRKYKIHSPFADMIYVIVKKNAPPGKTIRNFLKKIR